jgi:hypothetical protein
MANLNLKLEGNNNRFKDIDLVVSEQAATVGQLVATLPKGLEALVSFSRLDVIKADSTAGATMDIKVNGVVVNDEVKVDAVGVKTGTVAETVFLNGGDITIEPGATAPAGDGIIRLILRVENLSKRDGDYIS